MNVEGMIKLPRKIVSSSGLAEEFKSVFNSDEAKLHKNIVYFFMTEKPIPRVKGESNILYIGKTKQSLRQRYLRYSNKLASNRNGVFYKHIIDNFGAISIGYLITDNPKDLESKFFKDYCDKFLEYPPKSKVG